jgi:hypothetical protein
MSNVKVVKVDNLKLSGGGTKKSKKNPPKNVEYLQNIVRDTKKTPYLDLTQSELINKLLSNKSKKNMEVRISKREEPEKPKEVKKPSLEKPKEVKKPSLEKPKEEKSKISSNILAPPKAKKQKLPKKVGKKPSKKTIMSFFSKEDRDRIRKRTKRVKKTISSNLVAPKIDKKSKRNFYKMGVRNILEKDKSRKEEVSKMTREQLMNELVNKGIIEKESNAPTKVLKDLHQLYLLVGANISKQN